jgi:hypothetical protein
MATSRFCIIGIATSKASLATFLLRIAIIQWHKWVLYSMVVSVSIPCFSCALFNFIRCDAVAESYPRCNCKVLDLN